MTWQDQYQQDGGSAADLFQRYIVPRITSLWRRDLVDRPRARRWRKRARCGVWHGGRCGLAAAQSRTGRVVGSTSMRICSGLREAMPMRRVRKSNGVREALFLFPLVRAPSTLFCVNSGFSSFRTNPSPCAKWRVCSGPKDGSRLASSRASNELLSPTLSRTPWTGISVKAPLRESVPNIPLRFSCLGATCY